MGDDSWVTFDTLRLDPAFLLEDINDWPDSPAFQQSAENIKAISVVNDRAERGVKMSSDFLCASKEEQHYQNILQVVEHNRCERPNLRKEGSSRKPLPSS
jgi:hypothetical protein